MFRKTAAVAMLLAGLIAAPASAHRQWLHPSATVLSGDKAWVTVDAAVSNDLFYFEHMPLRLDNVKVWQPDGSEGKIQNGSTGRYRSVFDVELNQQGTWKIGTWTLTLAQGASSPVAYSAATPIRTAPGTGSSTAYTTRSGSVSTVASQYTCR